MPIKKKLTLQSCSNCGGIGYVTGIFHRMVCSVCNGLGHVDADTGDGLPADDVIEYLLLKIRSKDTQIDMLRERLANVVTDPKDRIYPPGSRRD